MIFRPILAAGLFASTILAAEAGHIAVPSSASVTREQADAILSELRQIRLLLERGPAAPTPQQQPQMPQPVSKAAFPIDTPHVLGSKDAPVTIVEFADAQCGFCRQFHAKAFAEIRKKYIDTGRVRFVARDMPLDVTTPSMRAAEAMRCAGEQDRYWELRDAILSGSPRVTNDSIRAQAQTTGIDMVRYDACVASGKHVAAIQKDIDQAAALKIGGTPSFVIGRSTADGVDGVTLVGALSFEAFEAKILEASPAKASEDKEGGRQ
ncbi:MAG: thioredoxin domain-containing protein [Bryobacteraceae bacterium]